jgi:ribosomal protein L32
MVREIRLPSFTGSSKWKERIRRSVLALMGEALEQPGIKAKKLCVLQICQACNALDLDEPVSEGYYRRGLTWKA